MNIKADINDSLLKIDQLSTIEDYLRWCCSEFIRRDLCFGHGADSAWDEAVFLLCYFTQLTQEELSRVMTAKFTQQEKSELLKLLNKRIIDRVPLAYLTNEVCFADIYFYIDDRVIIPKSPFAELIVNDFQPWLGEKKLNRVLDLCTGSGCMGLAVAHYNPEVIVDAVDISEDALDVARINTDMLGLEDRVNLISSDLFDNLDKKIKYDIIISNPPYVPSKSMQELPQEYTHEPKLALHSGDDGLSHANRILESAKDFLTEDGLLFLEVGEAQEALEAKYSSHNFVWISFENGGDGVLVISKQELDNLR